MSEEDEVDKEPIDDNMDVENNNIPCFNLMPGELSFTKEKLEFSIPGDLVFSGRRYSINVNGVSSIKKVEVGYNVKGGDNSSMNVTFLAVPISARPDELYEPGAMKGEHEVHITVTNNEQKATATLTYRPTLQLDESIVSDLNKVATILKDTDMKAFAIAFPFFSAIGTINPRSILTNSELLFQPILKRSLFNVTSIPLSLSQTDKPSLGWVIFKCGLEALVCVLSALAASTGIGIAAALAACGLLGIDCGELIGKYIDP